MLGQIEDRRAAIAAGCGPVCGLGRAAAEVAHVLDRDDDLDLERLADAGVDDGHRSRLTGRRPPAEEARHLLQRSLRGREPDALRRAGRDLLEPLEGQGEVGPALGRGEGVDLVDDDRLDTDERLRGGRRQHQVQALGGGDQQVRRAPDEALAVTRGRVAGAHGDLRRRRRPRRSARRPGRCRRAGRGGSSRRRRRGPAGARCRGPGCGASGPAGGGLVTSESMADRKAASVLPLPVGAQIRVWSPARDRRPPLHLRPGRLRERRGEPGPHGGRERPEHVVISDGTRLTRGCHGRSCVLTRRARRCRSGPVSPCSPRSGEAGDVAAGSVGRRVRPFCDSTTAANGAVRSPRSADGYAGYVASRASAMRRARSTLPAEV